MSMTENQNNKQQEQIVERVIVKEVSKWWDTHSYKWWLNSDSFIKRSLAVVWYNFAGALITYGIFFLIGLIIWLIVMIATGMKL